MFLRVATLGHNYSRVVDAVNKGPTQSSMADVSGGSQMTEIPDLDLVAKCQAGDRTAFRKLVQRYERRVYSIAFGFVRNREDALDLTQDAFVKVYRNLESFQATSSFYTWMYRVVVNVCIDFIRRERKHKKGVDYNDTLEHSGAAEGESPVVSVTTGRSPAKALSSKELGQKLVEGINNLAPAHKEILLLREVDGLSYEELAEVLEIPKGTVMSRLHHARLNLKKRLDDYLDE